MEENKETLKKKLKLNTIIICILIALLLISIVVLIVNVSSNGITNENNLSNLGMCVKADNYIFYYKYGKGIFKIKDKEEYQISDDTAYSLAYKDGYVYYTSPNSTGGIDIKKLSHNGDEVKVLKSTASSSTKMFLEDNYLYYITLSPNTISKIDINGENESVVLTRDISDFDIIGEIIYFTDNSEFLYKINLNGENYSEVSQETIGNKFQIYKNNVYYYKENSGLMKMNLKKATSELVSDKITSNVYNVTNKGIFFLDENSSKICKMSLKGKNCKELVDVKTTNTKINIVGNELYYLDLGSNNDSRTYRIKINGKQANTIEY